MNTQQTKTDLLDEIEKIKKESAKEKAALKKENAALKKAATPKKPKAALKPYTRSAKGGAIGKLGGLGSKEEYNFLVTNPMFKELFAALFKVIPRTMQKIEQKEVARLRKKISSEIGKFYRSSTGVAWCNPMVCLFGRADFHNTPNDIIHITLAAPLLQASPLRNDPALYSPEQGDNIYKIFKIAANDVLDSNAFDEFKKVGK